MRCPVDGTTLALTERAGVEIDYCPDCRGVRLDRGELDRIIERSSGGVRHDDRPVSIGAAMSPKVTTMRITDTTTTGIMVPTVEAMGNTTTTGTGRPGTRRGGAFSALTGLLGAARTDHTDGLAAS